MENELKEAKTIKEEEENEKTVLKEKKNEEIENAKESKKRKRENDPKEEEILQQEELKKPSKKQKTNKEEGLMIKNIGYDFSEQEIQDFLENEIGEIKEIKCFGGWCFFTFADFDNREICMKKLNGSNWNNITLEILSSLPNSINSSTTNTMTKSGDEEVRFSGCQTIFVAGIPYNYTNEDFFKMFEPYGTVDKKISHIFLDKVTQESRGMGVIELDSHENSKKAIDALQDKMLEGRKLFLKWNESNQPQFKPRGEKRFNQQQSNYQQQPIFNNQSGFQQSGGVGPQETEGLDLETFGNPTPKIFIRNLNKSVTRVELFNEFSIFGRIKDHYLFTDRITGQSKGFACITYFDTSSAIKAVKTNHNQQLFGQTIYLKFNPVGVRMSGPDQGTRIGTKRNSFRGNQYNQNSFVGSNRNFSNFQGNNYPSYGNNYRNQSFNNPYQNQNTSFGNNPYQSSQNNPYQNNRQF